MEDPAAEIRGVIKCLLERPQFHEQADAVNKYFTEDVVFKRPYMNVRTGRGDLIAFYKFAEIIVNYLDVKFKKVVYNPDGNSIDVEMDVFVRPWLQFWRRITLQFNTILDLKDVEDETTGKTVKKICGHRDYFLRSPPVQLIPLIGDIYDLEKLRDLTGKIVTTSFRAVGRFYTKYFPTKFQQALFKFWDEKLATPPSFLKSHTS